MQGPHIAILGGKNKGLVTRHAGETSQREWFEGDIVVCCAMCLQVPMTLLVVPI